MKKLGFSVLALLVVFSLSAFTPNTALAESKKAQPSVNYSPDRQEVFHNPHDPLPDSVAKRVVTEHVDSRKKPDCPDPETRSVKILKRGEPQGPEGDRMYPIRFEITVHCGSSIYSQAGEKTFKTNGWALHKDAYGQWEVDENTPFDAD